ncbi:hypothetical protein SF12_05210 [Streptomyces sp. MBRL 601]|nr:hypothetical protein SF12_05210 [Streptomyces sp. MBRL 601]
MGGRDNLDREDNGLSSAIYREGAYEWWYAHDLGTAGWLAVVLHLLAVPVAVATILYVSRLTALQEARRSGLTT